MILVSARVVPDVGDVRIRGYARGQEHGGDASHAEPSEHESSAMETGVNDRAKSPELRRDAAMPAPA
jgi:hypothetical protein